MSTVKDTFLTQPIQEFNKHKGSWTCIFTDMKAHNYANPDISLSSSKSLSNNDYGSFFRQTSSNISHMDHSCDSFYRVELDSHISSHERLSDTKCYDSSFEINCKNKNTYFESNSPFHLGFPNQNSVLNFISFIGSNRGHKLNSSSVKSFFFIFLIISHTFASSSAYNSVNFISPSNLVETKANKLHSLSHQSSLSEQSVKNGPKQSSLLAHVRVTRQSGSVNRTTGGLLPKEPDSCEVANIKCALRTGCGMAIQNYMLDCADLISGKVSECEEACSHSLLILTSTPEGRALMDCECSDQYCRDTKKRMEVCREKVISADMVEMSCTLAHLVCAADPRCSTAISYYDKYCRRMFIGRSCSSRCNNSISILQRQDQASQLENCVCDGTESFDCVNIKKNMARLCFHQTDEHERQKAEEETNEIDTSRITEKEKPKDSAAHRTHPLLNYYSYAVMYVFVVLFIDFQLFCYE